MCKAYVFLGRYAEAMTACEKAATEKDWWLNQVYLSAAFAQHGDVGKGVTAKNAVLQQQPGYTIDRYRRTYSASSPLFRQPLPKRLPPCGTPAIRGWTNVIARRRAFDPDTVDTDGPRMFLTCCSPMSTRSASS